MRCEQCKKEFEYTLYMNRCVDCEYLLCDDCYCDNTENCNNCNADVCYDCVVRTYNNCCSFESCKTCYIKNITK